MWRRLRRRSMAPSRPLLHPDEVGRVVIALVIIVVGLTVALKLLLS